MSADSRNDALTVDTQIGPMDQLSVFQKGLLLVCLPMVFQIVFVGSMSWMTAKAEESLKFERHSKLILMTTERIVGASFDGARLGWLSMATQSPESLKAAKDRLNEIRIQSAKLKELVASDPEQVRNYQDFVLTVDHAVDEGETLVAEGEQGIVMNRKGSDVLRDWRRTINKLSVKARKIADYEEKKRAELPLREDQQRAQLKLVLYAGMAASVVMTFLLLGYFTKTFSRRITFLKKNTERFAREEILLPQLVGADELSALDKSFHYMAATLSSSRRKERAILANSSDVICSLDTDLNFIEANQASLSQWGIEREAITGKNLLSMVVDSDCARVQAAFLSRRKEGHSAVEFRMQKADGTEVHTSWSLTWVAEEGTFYCVSRDVTEEQRLIRAKQEFMSMVSHDIRSPMTALKLLIESVSTGAHGELSSRGVHMLETANHSLSRIIRLVTQILDIDKAGAGEMILQLSEVKLIELISVVTELQSLADNKKLSVKPSVDPNDDELSLLVDKDRISQVLINLLSNAIKYSPRGGVIEIIAVVEGSWIKISVSDCGSGIPADRIETVFERFKQVADASGIHKQGTGLGLAISKTIIELHGGSIGVNSVEGKGSTFWILLPLNQSSAAVHPDG